jgi:hypothetical protein
LLNMGNVDMTLAVWCYLDSKPAAQMYLAGKYFGAAGRHGYQIAWDNVANRFYFNVRNTADTITTNLVATTFGAPALAAWCLVIACHDSVLDRTEISVNNGTVDTANTAGGILSNAEPFWLSRAAGGEPFWNGRIGPTVLWKSAAGGGGVLSAAQRGALWAGGVGLPYAEFTL